VSLFRGAHASLCIVRPVVRVSLSSAEGEPSIEPSGGSLELPSERHYLQQQTEARSGCRSLLFRRPPRRVTKSHEH
jgi:hypothetical protein